MTSPPDRCRWDQILNVLAAASFDSNAANLRLACATGDMVWPDYGHPLWRVRIEVVEEWKKATRCEA